MKTYIITEEERDKWLNGEVGTAEFINTLRNLTPAKAEVVTREYLRKVARDRYEMGMLSIDDTFPESCSDAIFDALQLPAPQTVGVGEEILHLVRFLANYQRTLCDIRTQVARLLHTGDMERARDLLIGGWPIIQGSQNQWDLETIGKQPFDMSKMRPAIKAILNSSAHITAQPAAMVEPSMSAFIEWACGLETTALDAEAEAFANRGDKPVLVPDSAARGFYVGWKLALLQRKGGL